VSEQADPERLLAEALRAQAVRAPLPSRPSPEPDPDFTTTESAESGTEARPAPPTDRLLGLLSGSDHQHDLLSGRTDSATSAAGTGSLPVGATATGRVTGTRPRRQLAVNTPAWQILLFAVLFGLLAGVIIGLVTVL